MENGAIVEKVENIIGMERGNLNIMMMAMNVKD